MEKLDWILNLSISNLLQEMLSNRENFSLQGRDFCVFCLVPACEMWKKIALAFFLKVIFYKICIVVCVMVVVRDIRLCRCWNLYWNVLELDMESMNVTRTKKFYLEEVIEREILRNVLFDYGWYVILLLVTIAVELITFGCIFFRGIVHKLNECWNLC